MTDHDYALDYRWARGVMIRSHPDDLTEQQARQEVERLADYAAELYTSKRTLSHVLNQMLNSSKETN